jgi:hypothetical protein
MYTLLILSGPTISALAIFLAAKGLQQPYPAIFGSGSAMLLGFGLWFWLKEERFLTQQ